ncbi:putative RNA-binding protein of the translin family [Thermoplasmatales archaeon BRNA1]|nr:putative RNA-binding protein of the translin family [Thermoplasmatales archaeon BRNA1]
MKIEDQTAAAAGALRGHEAAYERAFTKSRAIIRKTKTAIHGIHLGERDPELIDSISSDIAALVEDAAEYPPILFGAIVNDAMAEFAETVIYDYALRGEDPPSYDFLEITPGSWAEGLADSIGELRRDMLTALMDGRLEDAVALFQTMEQLSDALMTFDVRDGIAPLRRKQDIARGIMDRSRQDIATAKVMSKVQ